MIQHKLQALFLANLLNLQQKSLRRVEFKTLLNQQVIILSGIAALIVIRYDFFELALP